MKQSTNKTLVFSIALNGYGHYYRDNINSHRRYAKAHNYDYCCIEKPSVTPLGLECAWLKVALILKALQKGYQWVLFIDADAKIRSCTPAIQTLEQPEKYLYAAKGYTGRLNSGVLIVKNHTSTRALLCELLANATRKIPKQDDIGWGENGHFIYYTRHFKAIEWLDRCWNNNQGFNESDYIRHYSRGPVHHLYKPSYIGVASAFLSHCVVKALQGYDVCKAMVANSEQQKSFSEKLNELCAKAINHYPDYFYQEFTQPFAVRELTT